MTKESNLNKEKTKLEPLTNGITALSLLLLIVLTGCNSGKSMVTDMEGNNYETRKFEDVWWMTENLKTTKDKNGKSISYFIPNEDELNIKDYGLLYDYETACKICPKGWELPTNNDWDRLIEAEDKPDKNLSFKDSDFWEEEIDNGENGFSTRPSGYGNNGEHPNSFREKSILWSRSSSDEFGWAVIFEKDKSGARKAEQHKIYGFSVRCIKRQ